MKNNEYKEIFGIEKQVFDRLEHVLDASDAFQRKNNAGLKSRLSILDKLIITL